MPYNLIQVFGGLFGKESIIPGISPHELNLLISEGDYCLVDIREQFERDEYSIHPSVHMPSSQYQSSSYGLLKSSDKPVIFYCQKGENSLDAALSWLKLTGHQEIFYLIGGIEAWLKECDLN